MLTNHIEVKQILKLANSAIHFSPKANTKKKNKNNIRNMLPRTVCQLNFISYCMIINYYKRINVENFSTVKKYL